MIEVGEVTKAALMLSEAESKVSSLLGRKVRLLMVYDGGHALTEELIIQTTADITGVGTPDMMTDNRQQHVLFARYIVYSLLKKFLGLGPVAIADIFGRDHSSIVNGLKKGEAEYLTNKEYRAAQDKTMEEVIRRIR